MVAASAELHRPLHARIRPHEGVAAGRQQQERERGRDQGERPPPLREQRGETEQKKSRDQEEEEAILVLLAQHRREGLLIVRRDRVFEVPGHRPVASVSEVFASTLGGDLAELRFLEVGDHDVAGAVGEVFADAAVAVPHGNPTAFVGADAHRVHVDPLGTGSPRRRDGLGLVVLSVGEDDDELALRALEAIAILTADEQLRRLVDRAPDGRALHRQILGVETVEVEAYRAVVARQGRLHERDACEDDQPDPVTLEQVERAIDLVERRVQATRGHIAGQHRTGDVHGEDDVDAFSAHFARPFAPLRAGHRHDDQRHGEDRENEACDLSSTAPARPHLGDGRWVSQASRRRGPPGLVAHEERDHQRGHGQQEEGLGLAETNDGVRDRAQRRERERDEHCDPDCVRRAHQGNLRTMPNASSASSPRSNTQARANAPKSSTSSTLETSSICVRSSSSRISFRSRSSSSGAAAR